MTYHTWKWGFWIRLKYGKGICVQINKRRSFSERNGYRTVYRVGSISLEFLEPIKD